MSAHLKPSAQRLVDCLRRANGQWVHGVTLGRADVAGFRYSARILDARAAGIVIEGRRFPGSAVWFYRIPPQPQLDLGLAS